uniref:MARVEL domain-containing protein n=1 Tax=Parastrongyloides trichosuri TaxID=131310 RepID=A0A0N4ZMJ2_PARTI
MDFSPTADKWKCCCCFLPQGLQVLAGIEISVFLTAFIITLIFTITSNSMETSDYIFNYSFLLVLAFSIMSSILLIIGLRRIITTLLYPTILARISLIVFVQLFGVSKTLLTDSQSTTIGEEDIMINEKIEFAPRNNYHKTNSKHFTAMRFVGFVFLFIFFTVALIYTIYLIVRALKYVNGYSKLLRRRSSLIAAELISDNMIAQHYKIENMMNESKEEHN